MQSHVEPFIGSQSDFFATAKSPDGADLFPNQQYAWNGLKSPYPAVIPGPPPGDQPLAVATQKAIDDKKRIAKIIGYVLPVAQLADGLATPPEWWQDAVETFNLAKDAAQIPDREIIEKSTPDKRLRWYHGPVYDAPINPVTVRAQATGDAPGSPVIRAGKVKINWAHPKKRLYQIKVFPVEWGLPHSGTATQQFCYTFFSHEDIVSKIDEWVDVQIAMLAGGDLAGEAPGVAKEFQVLFDADKTAAQAADEAAALFVKRAEAQGTTGAAAEAETGKVRTSATRVDEAGNPTVGEEADSATGERAITKTPTGCFVAGTPVLMADNSLKPIEKLKIGDVVLSRDPISGEIAPHKVILTTIHKNVSTLVLQFADGQTIETTSNHPFFISGPKTGEWIAVPAASLVVGESVQTRTGTGIALTHIERAKQMKTVYNCSVEDFHTYFVGNSSLWVHNVFCTKEPLDPLPYPRDPSSQILAPGIEPGEYVYVRDAEGVVYIGRNGPHMHPKVLGGGQAASGAGTLIVGPDGSITEVTNISGTFQFGPETIDSVIESITGQGMTVAPGAKHPFNWN